MILICDYDSKWPTLFEAEKNNLLNILGSVISIEHIGSTAIPKIAAKPMIDIMVGITSLENEENNCVAKMIKLGYQYIQDHEAEIPYLRYFRKKESEKLFYNVHILEPTKNYWKGLILFRDYMRAHPEEAKRYETFKKEISAKYSDINLYGKAKTEFIMPIYEKAINWLKEVDKG